MFASTTFALLSILGLAIGSPIEKRATNVVIRLGRSGECLSLPAGTNPSNGVGLVTRDCVAATHWDISPGSGSIIVSSTNYALDAGVPQGNNNPAKVWQSYNGSQQQTWSLTSDNHIAVTGGNQCLDMGPNGPQTYQCTYGNTNQVWYVDQPHQPSSSTKTAPTAAPTATVASRKNTNISFRGRNFCAVVYGTPANGLPVTMEPCYPSVSNQRFDLLENGLIQVPGTNFCFDAGSNPSNGVAMKLWQCYPGLAQQTFTFPLRQGQYRTANNQCLDVDSGNSSKLQTWACSSTDPQQLFSD